VDVHAVYRVFQNWFRPRRMRKMTVRSGMTSDTTVLDVGGTELNWEYSQVRPVLTILNVTPNSDQKIGQQVVGDGCRLPFGDNAFDFVFSNSVIEHVSDHEAFAREIARVGKKYYVQTPNKWFLIEPHLMTPFIHLLPLSWRHKLLKHFTVWGMIAKPSDQECEDFLASTHLIGTSELLRLFPGASLERERFLGMTKSISVWGGVDSSASSASSKVLRNVALSALVATVLTKLARSSRGSRGAL
jgi:SAM-dependent methyltransferase